MQKLRIFAVAPSDMTNERNRIKAVALKLKPLADSLGIVIEIIDWRAVVPNMGRAEQVILDQIKPTSWDVLIGILWHRFGTPPDGINPSTKKEYQSGTEEEFTTAYRFWKQHGRPRIMVYRCIRNIPPGTLNPDQYKRVKEFFDQFDARTGEHPGLYQTFTTIKTFEDLLFDNIQKLLLEYGKNLKAPEYEIQLKKLESQAIQFELKGDLWNARKTWYEIKQIDLAFPRIDIKIGELEREIAIAREREEKATHLEVAREKEKRELAEKAKREKKERYASQLAAIKKTFSEILTTIKSTLVKTKFFLRLVGAIGFFIVLLVVLWTQMWPKPATVPLVFSGVSGGEVNIYSYDAKNKIMLPQVEGGGQNWDPTISASGNIYFTSNREDNKAEIYRLINGKVERVTNTPGQYESWDPAVSASGNIYFTSNRQDGKAEVYRFMNGKIERVTYTPEQFESWGPVVSDSGNIYFTSNREDGKAEVYRFINGKTERVTHTPGQYESWEPEVSDNGNIYFTSNREDGKAEVYRFINGETERVTYTPAQYESWGPVVIGQDLFFTSNRSYQREIYLLNSQTISISEMTSWTTILDEKSPTY